MTKQPRVLTAQAFACLGKSSGSTALPVLTAMGLECGLLPTALLSTHTGFPEATFLPLTQQMTEIIAHWRKQDLRFDGMYLGYLTAPIQAALVGEVVEKLANPHCVVVVDPVMGDNGKLYHGFDNEFVEKMYTLCSYADIICPNVTEACFLTGIPYKELPDEDYALGLARKLKSTGAGTIVITGIVRGDEYGALCYDAATDKFHTHYRSRIPGVYCGTGDIFASVLSSTLTIGKSLEEALDAAIDFVHDSILNTQDEKEKYYYGVKFEQCLGKLCDIVK